MSTSIESLFASKPLVRVLSVLLMHPDQRFYQQQLVKVAGVSLRPAQLALERLEQSGLVEKRIEGRNRYYRIRRDHPAFEGLRLAFVRTISLGDVLRDALTPLGERVAVAFVFGSIARGDDRPDSDVDVIAVGDTSLREISDATENAELLLGRELNLLAYDPEEFREKASDEHGFVAEALSGPKIWLVGGEDELERLVGRRDDPKTAGQT